jgi:hypothetical protein
MLTTTVPIALLGGGVELPPQLNATMLIATAETTRSTAELRRTRKLARDERRITISSRSGRSADSLVGGPRGRTTTTGRVGLSNYPKQKACLEAQHDARFYRKFRATFSI